ncbi:MAG: hypothetical protein QXI38_02040 [Conexivisphaerales archaeon]
MRKRKVALAILVILLMVMVSFGYYYVYIYEPGSRLYQRTLFYKYVVNDSFEGNPVNYTEYAIYKLLGVHGGVMHILAEEELETYMVVINATTGRLIGAYYNNPPYYNLSFGSNFYEPMVIFERNLKVGSQVPLLNYNFTVASTSGNTNVLLYRNDLTNSSGISIDQLLVYTYSKSTGYMLNGTTLYIYSSMTKHSTIRVQILLVSATSQ